MELGLGLSPALVFFIAGIVQPGFLFLSLFGVAAAFRSSGLRAELAIAAALVTLSVTALTIFWLEWSYVHAYPMVRIAAAVAMLAATALAGLALWQGQWRDEVAVPIGLALMATLVLLLWVHVGSDLTSSPLRRAATRWTHPLPSDNSIPLSFARAIADGFVPHGQPSVYFGEWLSSDRPPLQTALLFLTPGYLTAAGASEEVYQSTAVALQMLVLVGAWTLARSLGADRRSSLSIMIAVFFTPLVLVNGGFVWPKLLAATFLMVAATIHFSPMYFEIRHQAATGALVGALGCLAMLSHGATAFALVGMVIASLVLRRVGSLQYVAGAIIAFGLIYSPWMAYQTFVDPPGDRLLKWHLAGVLPIDPRPFFRTLIDSYQSRSWNEGKQISG